MKKVFLTVTIILLTAIAVWFLFPWKTDIALQPYSGFDSQRMEQISKFIGRHFNANITHLEAQPIPNQAYYPPRGRYRADSLIRILRTQISTGAEFDKILGLTSYDISTTKDPHEDWGIFGLAFSPGSSCIVSSFRIGSDDGQTTETRLLKITMHELGHNFGLHHCSFSNDCVMADACGSIKTVDQVDSSFCTKCRLLIAPILK